jgi:hypothetical protein
MKSVPNLISYLHEFSWNFLNSYLFILSYFRPGVNFNLEITDMRDPPVSHRFPRQARLSARSLRCAAAFAAPPATALVPFRCRHRRLRLGSRQAMPSARCHLHRELNRAAVHAPVRPRHALPCAASRVLVTSLPQSTRVAPPCAAPLCALRRARSRRAKLGRTRCAGQPRRYCATGSQRIRPRDSQFIFLFSKYIEILTNSKFCVGFI